MSVLPGTTIRDYAIREEVGSGGYGIIFKAQRLSDGLEVAIKVMRPEQAHNQEASQRFEQEAQLIAQLDHPNIIPLLDRWHDPLGAFIVMPWLAGGSLRHLYTAGRWSLAQTVIMLDQITDALDMAHRLKIVHRDIKPDNILFDGQGSAVLSDFGIARRTDSQQRITIGAGMIGSPAYLAPEQIFNRTISPQTDLYGLGITLFEALTGQHPFADAVGSLNLMLKQLQEKLPPVEQKNPALPPGLNAVIQKATAKEAQERHPSARALYEDFYAAAEGSF